MNQAERSYTFDWRTEEHAEVASLLMREQFSSRIWRALRWLLVIFLALATVVVVVAAIAGDMGSVVRLGPLTLLVGVLVLKFPYLTSRLQAWRVARNDPNVKDPIRHVFTDQGLRVEMRTLDAELKWSGIYAVRETDAMFLFYYSKRTAYYLPKRVVGVGDDAEALSGWIQGQLPPETPYFPPEEAS